MLLLTTLVIAGTYIQRSHAQGSTFNYQGVLSAAGIAANGSFDLQFRLYDDPAGGSQIGTTVLREDVLVKNGLFTVPLDFGLPAFSGALRYLEIGVRVGASTGGFSLLTPREPINPTPYAMTSVNFSGSLAGDVVGGQGGTRVVAIQGRQISTNQPLNGQVLGYNTDTNRYEPMSVSSSGGDASWDYVTSSTVQLQPNRRYAVDSSTRVALTLPVSPKIGDTIEILSPGTNGWGLLRGALGQYVFGYEQTPVMGVPDRYWRSVASSADGLRLVASDGNGTLYTSIDGGLNWTPREINRSLVVASSADGQRLFAIDYNGILYISADSGVNWISRGLDILGGYCQSLALSADGLRLYALVASYPNGVRIAISGDGGETWGAYISPPGNSLLYAPVFGITSSANGERLTFISDGTSSLSANGGVSWTQSPHQILDVPDYFDTFSIRLATSVDGLRLVVSATGLFRPGLNNSSRIFTSENGGLTWTRRLISGSVVASSADGRRLIVGGDQIYTTTDGGETWTERRRNLKRISAVASSADGFRLVAAEENGQIFTSQDGGVTWRYPGTPPDPAVGVPLLCGGSSSMIKIIYTGNGRFFPFFISNIRRYQDGC